MLSSIFALTGSGGSGLQLISQLSCDGPGKVINIYRWNLKFIIFEARSMDISLWRHVFYNIGGIRFGALHISLGYHFKISPSNSDSFINN